VADTRIAGSRKLFSAANIVEVRVAQVLLQAGVARARVASIMAIRWPPAGGADWFDPLHPLGQASALMVIREPPAAGTGRVFLSGDDEGEPQSHRSWVGAVIHAVGKEFELIRVDVPDGWQPPSPEEERHWGELKGARVIWLVNVRKIRDDIRARLYGGS
jgi:hypothetical protein